MSQSNSLLDTSTLGQAEQLTLVARKAVEGFRAGPHRSRLTGPAIEFDHHRPYTLGDDTKQIDWRVHARTGKLFTKVFQQETNLCVRVVLEATPAMRLQGEDAPLCKFAYAQRVAASLAFLVATSRDSVAMTLLGGEKITELTELTSNPARVDAAIELLAEEQPGESPKDFGELLRGWSNQTLRRGLIILLGDFLLPSEECRLAVSTLLGQGHSVTAVHLFDPVEQTLPSQNVVQFRDLATNTKLRVRPDEVRQEYDALLAEALRNAESLFMDLGADYVRVNTSSPLGVALAQIVLGEQG